MCPWTTTSSVIQSVISSNLATSSALLMLE